MKRRTFSHKPGFTLVEMIIIISVIAILSTISIIAYQYIRQDAYDAKAKTALQQIETAFKSYITAGNKVPMRYYSPYGFYTDPGGGSTEQGIPINNGGGIGKALVNAGFLSSNLLDSLKNGPQKNTALKNSIAFAQCGKNKAFFYIEVYRKGMTQAELWNKVHSLECERKTKDDWYAEHGLSPSLSMAATGTVNGPARYILAEIDFT